MYLNLNLLRFSLNCKISSESILNYRKMFRNYTREMSQELYGEEKILHSAE